MPTWLEAREIVRNQPNGHVDMRPFDGMHYCKSHETWRPYSMALCSFRHDPEDWVIQRSPYPLSYREGLRQNKSGTLLVVESI